MKECPICGKIVENDLEICPHCEKLNEDNNKKKKKRKLCLLICLITLLILMLPATLVYLIFP